MVHTVWKTVLQFQLNRQLSLSSNPMHRYFPKINKNIFQHSLIHEIHSNFIYKSTKLETTQGPSTRE